MKSLLLALVLGSTLLHAAEPPQRMEFTHAAMGTQFRISLYAADSAAAERAVQAAWARVAEIEQVASDYLPETELCQLCLSTQPRDVSADMRALLIHGQTFALHTHGAFDITAGHLTQLWRRSKRRMELPSSQHLQRALSLTGWQRIHLAEQVQLQPQTQLDMGGLAKGYAADAALKVLKNHGLACAVVAASGDLALGAAPPGQVGWEVYLRTFEKEEQADQRLRLELQHCGVSTSGDLHQFIQLAGQRYSHIIDPKTGLGLTQRIACSVIAPDATTSDALATALCVLGVEQGGKVLQKHYPRAAARWATPQGSQQHGLHQFYPHQR
jgi:FAD:protein FMN transferase